MDIAAALVPLSEAGRVYGDLHALVSGGDDLQIAFTASPDKAETLRALATRHNIKLTRIGKFLKSEQWRATLLAEDGAEITLEKRGFRHF